MIITQSSHVLASRSMFELFEKYHVRGEFFNPVGIWMQPLTSKEVAPTC